MRADTQEILTQLRSLANPKNVEGMARYGINPQNTLGISIPVLRKIARQHHHDHRLALELWTSGTHEARILASLIDDPEQVTEEQMERWANDFDSWDIVDQCCTNLFSKNTYAQQKVIEWSDRPEEYIKRAAFTLMANLSIHDKKAPDNLFSSYLAIIIREANDERNYVKKAVNWALRQIGKRNASLNRLAIHTAKQIHKMDSKAARWNAKDALRELTSEKVRVKLLERENHA